MWEKLWIIFFAFKKASFSHLQLAKCNVLSNSINLAWKNHLLVYSTSSDRLIHSIFPKKLQNQWVVMVVHRALSVFQVPSSLMNEGENLKPSSITVVFTGSIVKTLLEVVINQISLLNMKCRRLMQEDGMLRIPY